MGCPNCKESILSTETRRKKLRRPKAFGLERKTKAPGDGFDSLILDRYLRDCIPSIEASPHKNTSGFDFNIGMRGSQLSYSYNNLEIVENNSKPSTLLYHFDKLNDRFYWFEASQSLWKQNSLSKAHLILPSTLSPSKSKKITRSEILKKLHSLSSVAISNKRIHLIGPWHLEYDIARNHFKAKGPCNQSTNPILVFDGTSIYNISGEQEDKLLQTCQKYDIQKNMWSSLPDLSLPHSSGSGIAFFEKEFQSEKKRTRVLVIGGYQSKKPMIPNPNISIYDSESQVWSYTPLNKLTDEIPLFVCPSIVQSAEGRIFILGTILVNECYELVLDKECQKLTKVAEIPQKNKSENRILQSCMINEKDEIEVLFLNNFCQAVTVKGAYAMQKWGSETQISFDIIPEIDF